MQTNKAPIRSPTMGPAIAGNAGPQPTGQRKGSGPIPARVRLGRTFKVILD
jgi:hypothetical protein